MKAFIFLLTLISILAIQIQKNNLGIDQGAYLKNTANYTLQSMACLENMGMLDYSAVLVQYKANEWVPVTNLSLIRLVGGLADLVVNPYLQDSVDSSVQKLFETIPANQFGMIWINVKTANVSCNYLQSFIASVQKRGKKIGICSDIYSWFSNLGDTKACPQVATQPLWYNSISNFYQFGGWTKYNRKTMNNTITTCTGSSPGYELVSLY